MKKEVRSPTLLSLLVLLFAASTRAALLPIDSQREDQIKTAVQEIFFNHGFTIDKSHVILIREDGKITVAMDISETLAVPLADQIIDEIRKAGYPLGEKKVELNLFGSAESLLMPPEARFPPAQGWKDVLSDAGRAPVSIAGISDEPVQNTMEGQSLQPYSPNYQNTDIEKARSIILIHLLKIHDSGTMGSTILMENYWKDVFTNAGAPELFDVGRPLITQALVAGIKPYRDGKSLEASVFADLAMNALGLQPVRGTGASIILFKP